ncbi:probable mediator of RNA polymerase II transcription subunit 26c [Brachypodium distachyon]|uniref:TFIIS N-terminal domain-containing protein n=1 Tax=Brachypodium distachyon TaxID=15368 RepID=I1GWH0_BRADI|nr:probable mediator of RNA polymerase II transcription subunit 26c [Brachypodium distachyon]KQK17304.1 hypothetical protein BRADI_1g33580v3 [Brachypodium distachyon]|eukprot:XP_003560492.1 probable mediator of RNA polymerase II transcription subunit 26c [Brachypodium distachyon]
MAAQSPLRRWKPFFAAFDNVDAAIEAADPDLRRDELREARGDIVELLCNAMDDDREAERLCLILDDVMAESLETLRLVPAMPTVLAKTDIAKAVRALQKHESERVRVLARGIVSRWGATFQDDLVRFRAATEKLDQIPMSDQIVADQQPVSAKILQPSAKNTRKITEMPPPQPKKVSPAPAVGVVRGDRAGLCSDDTIMEATKRKFQEGYQEAENAKRQRRIQVVEAPEMLKQRQRKMHPIIKERSRAKCGSSMMVKKTISVSKIRRV